MNTNDQVKMIKRMGLNRQSNYIKQQSRFGMDLDYQDSDNGEPRAVLEVSEARESISDEEMGELLK